MRIKDVISPLAALTTNITFSNDVEAGLSNSGGRHVTEKDARVDEALDGLDQDKRDTLRRLVRGTTFAAPVVASFAMQGISINPAHAAIGSSSNTTIPPI
jgi:hypothetical protein